MTTSDARKRRDDDLADDIKISRISLLEVATTHRQIADDIRTLASRHVEAAIYIEGLVEGSRPGYRAE